MKDNEIITALEYCLSSNYEDCLKCPLHNDFYPNLCHYERGKNVLDLINRQKAEIERLKDYNSNLITANTALSNEIFEIKSEAIKEFAERLSESLEWRTEPLDDYDIDELVKEMTEGVENA